MTQTLKAFTYETPSGKRAEGLITIGQPLTRKREKFCQLVAFGGVPSESYIEAYERVVSNDHDLKRVNTATSQLMCDTDVVLRIQELRRPVVRKLQKKYEYSLNKALEQCQQAWDVAYAQGDAKGMLKAIEMQGRFTKLLSDQIDVNHRYGLLDDASTDVLLEMRKAIEDKKQRRNHHGPIVVGEFRVESSDPPEAPFTQT